MSSIFVLEIAAFASVVTDIKLFYYPPSEPLSVNDIHDDYWRMLPFEYEYIIPFDPTIASFEIRTLAFRGVYICTCYVLDVFHL